MLNKVEGRLPGEELEAVAHRAWLAGAYAPEELDVARDHAALLSLVHAVDALMVDGVLDEPGLVEQGAVAERHRSLLRCWVNELATRGAASLQGDGEHGLRLEWSHPVPAWGEVEDAWREAERLQPESGRGGALTRFFARASAILPDLLADTVQLQALLFEDDTVSSEIYETNGASRYTNAAAAAAIRAVALSRPEPLRIWEVGGGVGATSDVVLDALAEHDVRYHFTDVGRWFLDRALDRWAGRAGLSVGLADINDPELPSGLGGAAYDVVLAANVLHNALDPVATLRRIAAVTAEDGRLVMIETGTEHLPLLVSMRFLMSPGDAEAPGFADERAATGRIFLDLPAWRRALTAAGWSLEVLLPGEDSDHPIARYDQHLLVASRASTSDDPRAEEPA